MKTIEQWSLALVLLKFPLPTAMQTGMIANGRADPSHECIILF